MSIAAQGLVSVELFRFCREASKTWVHFVTSWIAGHMAKFGASSFHASVRMSSTNALKEIFMLLTNLICIRSVFALALTSSFAFWLHAPKMDPIFGAVCVFTLERYSSKPIAS